MASRVEARARRGMWPLGAWVRKAAAMLAAQRSRRALARLDKRLLDDIGLEWTEAQREAARRLWDAPDHWFSDRRGPL